MTTTALTRKDFVSDQEVRWCPGCGDYAILATVLKVLPTLGVPKENIAFISGIGCSSRFPYYVDTYGFHTIHGRAPTVATGLACANPDLDLWIVTGDGDGMSIGGNHLIHLLRRNVNVKVLLFNNRIYGLTKGQYSPTSEPGTKSKSTPTGSLDYPLNPASLALGAEASFVARAADNQLPHLESVLKRAAAHKGTAFVEILQNCVIFNDKVFEPVIGKDVRNDQQVFLEEGQPLVYGKDSNKGLRANGFGIESVSWDADGAVPDDLIVHHENSDPAYHQAIAHLGGGALPLPLGVLKSEERATFERQVKEQRDAAVDQAGALSLNDMYTGFGKAATWDV
jgi:2-oxoglutarate ferredoxin oxidoreductase subunit beta